MSALAMLPDSANAKADEATALWAAFGHGRDESVRQQLVKHYLEFARMLAARLYARRTFRELEFDDYLQYARLGLMESVDRYDARQGARFETFAALRINGAILTGIASYSEVQEQVAARRKVLSDRLDGSLQAAPLRDDPAALFAHLADLAVGLALGFALEGTGMVRDADAAYVEQAYDGVEVRQLRARLKEMLAGLGERQRKVLSWHYLEQRGFDEIATHLGIGKSRVSQLHTEGLATLRRQWRLRDVVDWSF
ncbi:sigma-70 family RNA polymerase sigma factor [Pseudoduganella chitinolytica]|uniref:Sigma-70 family RNA polymerase sigma factor n=1 Tax=Pseudoduganella chitinolytica TaxID=34070 RepID=A0ABY8BAN7_9BURK|nr:sigma-70 family RNA polymerase sigma factor [Pseudoduganella chitinolytica]WEF32860.1 sigma-70 family RNA polymerase sigma factor [Pseudoduganella chitinolytica]